MPVLVAVTHNEATTLLCEPNDLHITTAFLPHAVIPTTLSDEPLHPSPCLPSPCMRVHASMHVRLPLARLHPTLARAIPPPYPEQTAQLRLRMRVCVCVCTME